MGATKRISELLWQTYAKRSINNKITIILKNTIFAMVRFGNVLDSSGSVVPLFKKTNKNGGPLTVTHKDVIRFYDDTRGSRISNSIFVIAKVVIFLFLIWEILLKL